ncbi:MAG: bifunctional riboflavin kinase/FAD synthetase [Syntrophomonadaceae bacterium]|nr:bifunctional riboflavin kinase/FAD synthetase [Syntrophomonadaceae bacterium]
MEIIREITNYQTNNKPLYLALGNFDGVHKGHKKLLSEAVKIAQDNNGFAAALIFDPHPNKVLNPDRNFKLITKNDKQAELLREIGIDILIYNSFNKEISQWIPEDFVKKVIISKLNAKHVFVGFNYSFGYKGQGTPELLKKLGDKYNFAVSIIPPVSQNNQVVSSSIIREMIENGQIKKAKNLLDYYPVVTGIVVEGDKRGGDKIGFPTANLKVDGDIIIPATGVYAAKAKHKGTLYNCVVNVGRKPTFHDNHPVTIEAHIIDFSTDIYGDGLEIIFLDKIRDEMKFADIDSLAKQISIDKDTAKRISSATKLG